MTNKTYKKIAILLAVGAILAIGGYVAALYGSSGPDAAPNLSEYGLVGYWNMEEGTGQTVYDRSGNGNNGTLGASASVAKDDPVFTSGYSSAGAGGTGLKFDGKDDYVNAGDKADFQLSKYSWSMWIRGNSAPAVAAVTQPLFNADEQFQFNWNHPTLAFVKSAAHKSGTTWYKAAIVSTLSANTWYFITATYDGTNIKIYLNGKLEASAAAPAPNALAGILAIGSAPTTDRFNGSIDEVRVYNRALSADEIRQHYNQKKPVLEMKFDEGSGQKAYDESFNNNDGWLGGTSAVEASDPTWVTGKFGSALSFDGGDDYVDAGNGASLNITQSLTVAAWIKYSVVGTSRVVGKHGGGSYGWTFGVNTNKLVFGFSTTGSEWNEWLGNTTLTAGTWYHVTAMRDYSSGNVDIYLNGIKDRATANLAGQINIAPSNTLIGKDTFTGYKVNGSIDSVRIYNYARAPAEILVDYNNGLAGHLR